MQHSIEMISPQTATEYLEGNTGNRSVRVAHVRNIAGAMKRGEWRLTHQGIAFSAKGRLLDGQHRLHGVIAAGVTVQMVVVRGLPDETFLAVDLGNRRTTADVLAEDQRLVEVANLCLHLTTGTTRATPDEVAAWLPRLSDTHTAITCGRRVNRRVVSSAGMRLAAILSVEDGCPLEYVKSIYQSLLSMDMEALPPVGRSLIAKIAGASFGGSGSGRAISYASLAHGMVAFDPDRADQRRITIKDPMTSINWARSLLRRMESSNA